MCRWPFHLVVVYCTVQSNYIVLFLESSVAGSHAGSAQHFVSTHPYGCVQLHT